MPVTYTDWLFTALPWPALLMSAALAALAIEAVLLVRWCRRGRTVAAGWALAAVALAGGPVVAFAVAVSRGLSPIPPGGLRRRGWLRASLWATALQAMGVLTLLAGPVGAIATLTLMAGLWSYRSYRQTTAELSPRDKRRLTALRMAAMGCLGLWAMGLTLQTCWEREVPATLLIGIDASSSMQRRDAGNQKKEEMTSRLDAVKEALKNCQPTMDLLYRQADVEYFSFGASASAPRRLMEGEAPGWLMLRAAEPATALGDALAAAFDPFSASELDMAGMLIFSDGCNNSARTLTPEKLSALMGSRRVPIYAVGVGSEHIGSNIAALNVTEVAAADDVQAAEKLPITASVQAFGLAGRSVQVTCRLDDETVGEQTLDIKDNQATLPVAFTHTPLAAGYHRLTVSAQCLNAPPANLSGQNRGGKLIHVTDRQIRVLYVEGRFRYEAKYIAQALAGAGRIVLDRRILGEASPSQAFGERLEDWIGYHAILFGDVAPSHFSANQLAIIRRLVGDYGKGFAMIGGRESFSRRWAGTPIAELLPVEIQEGGQIDQPVSIIPQAGVATADLLAVGETDQDSAALWKKLPPLPGANRLGPLKPAAVTLAQTPRGEPMLVAQNFGKGRTLAVAFDSTWRWVLAGEDSAAAQKRFWRQVVTHLAAPKGNVWIATDKAIYDLNSLSAGQESVRISAGVEDSSGKPIRSAPMRVTLTGPDGAALDLQMAGEGDLKSAQAPLPSAAGQYVITISTQAEGKALSAEHRFEVVYRDLESMDVLANHALLRRMAQLSGGRFVPLDQWPTLLEEITAMTRPRSRVDRAFHNLSDRFRWPLLAVVVTLLTVEWMLRKRKGLL